MRGALMKRSASRLLGVVSMHPTAQTSQAAEREGVHCLGEDVSDVVVGGDLASANVEVAKHGGAPSRRKPLRLGGIPHLAGKPREKNRQRCGRVDEELDFNRYLQHLQEQE